MSKDALVSKCLISIAFSLSENSNRVFSVKWKGNMTLFDILAVKSAS